jgi:uncharacterized phage-associated protein
MATAHDVAAYILRKQGPMDTWKLQKLLYYCQAWHLVWEGKPLFEEKIEAWSNGPVIWDIYDAHRGKFSVSQWPEGRIGNLTASERSSIDVVLRHYGRLTGFTLRERTHAEQPWRVARERSGALPGQRSDAEITRDDMYDFYGSL